MADLPNPDEAITINYFWPGIRGHPPLRPWSLWVTPFPMALNGGLAELARRTRVSAVSSEGWGTSVSEYLVARTAAPAMARSRCPKCA
jgi:hypothetical protein